MRRTEVLLEDWQHRALRAASEREGRSISAIVRELIDERFGDRAQATLEAITALGRDPDATGRDHDRHLYDDPAT